MPKNDLHSSIFFSNMIVDMQMEQDNAADIRANFLMVLAGLIFSISMTQLFNSTGIRFLGFSFLILVSLTSILFSIFIIHPRLWSKKTHKVGLIYFSSIIKNFSREDFESKFLDILKDDKKIAMEYATEIYNHSIILHKKFNILKKASSILFIGIIIGAVLIFSSFI